MVPPYERSRLPRRGVEIGARVTFKGQGVPEMRIVFRRGNRETHVTCVHVAMYAGPLESLPPEAEHARSSENHPVHLAPEEPQARGKDEKHPGREVKSA